MREQELKDWVPLMRKIASDKRGGKLSTPEYRLYTWMLNNSNPQGISVVNLEALNMDVFDNTVEINSVNKWLISLKKKRYIYYEKRSGRRGSFEVKFGNIMIKRGWVTSLDEYFATDGNLDRTPAAEHTQSLVIEEQRLNSKKTVINYTQDKDLQSLRSRGLKKHTDNEKYKDRYRGEKISINSYQPNSHETWRCREIAKEVGEKDMTYILSVNKKHGIDLLERAFVDFKSVDSSAIKNKPAYFNKIIQGLTEITEDPQEI